MHHFKGGTPVWIAGMLAGLVLHAHTAAAATYFVRTSGSDTSDGLTPQTAFATIRHAGRLLLAPGDRVVVGPGTYDEGNIEPLGSGTRDMPVVFEGDGSGQQTGDAPGPVTIRPPNAEDSTSGFIIYGKHDVLITGFVVDGAADAGIQVRENFSTGVDSTRVVIVDNVVTNSVSRGIHVIAAGDVEVARNMVTHNGVAGISLLSGQSSTLLRPSVHDNLCESNGVGIAAERIAGGTIEDNAIRFGGRGIGIAAGAQVLIRRNEISDVSVPAVVSIADLDFVDNVIEGGGAANFATSGTSTLLRNRHIDGGTSLHSSGMLRLVENELASVFLEGRAALELLRNEGSIFSGTASSITAIDNRWAWGAELLGTEEAQITTNTLGGPLEVSGDDVRLEGNTAANTRLVARSASILDNRIGWLVLVRGDNLGDPPAVGGSYVVRGNHFGGDVVLGERRPPARVSSIVVEENEIEGSLSVTAHDQTVVDHNTAVSIYCDLSASESEVTVSDNVVRGYAYSGIIIRGARGGTVERNSSSQNVGSGFAIRRVSNLTFSDNTAFANQRGGISVDIGSAVVGDCNNDYDVTVDEIIRAVDIVLGNRRLGDCMAIDASGDEIATVDEVILALDAALNGTGDEPAREGRVFITGNAVEDNARYGIDLFTAGAVSVRDNHVLRNGGIGVSAQLSGAEQSVDILRNFIGANVLEGVLLGGTAAAEVRDNVIFSNGDNGVLLRNARGVAVVNNLIYDNENDAIAVGVGTPLAAPDAVLMNNTLYANDGWGVTIGTALAPSTGTTVLNNIIDGNSRGGIAAQVMSLPGLDIGFNLNNDGYAHDVAPSVTDFQADPRFVDVFGPDNVLGDYGFEDDDFHLQAASAAIDAGSATATQLGITGSAVAGDEGDEGIVDLGFHYPDAVEPQP